MSEVETQDATPVEAGVEDGEATIVLGEDMKGEQAQPLSDQLLQHRCKNLELDAGDVSRIDTPCLEVLLSAARLWQSDGYQIRYARLSEAFSETAELLGMQMSNFEVLEAQQ